MKEQTCTAQRFFAAANGATGFRSYFDEIFPSDSLDAVFILKGGPGTGKSTLLKELAESFSCPDIQQEIFHCSSDPKSLDGLLLTKNGRRAAILDGTAPHERDARIPGATDHLVNLGEGFDTEALRKNRQRILTLQKKKSIFYKDAYFYLGLFGIFRQKCLAEAKERINKAAVRAFAEGLLYKETGKLLPRPIGAFSRDGQTRLDTYEKISKRKIFISGEEEERLLFLTATYEALRDREPAGYFSPTPFFGDLIDGLFLKECATAITTEKAEGGEEIFTKDFFLPSTADRENRSAPYKAEAARYLSLAREALLHASESHFALEEIYTPAMHFDRLCPIKAALKKEISATLRHREIS